VTVLAVRAEGLAYSYGERRALDDLGLEIRPREIFSVLGPNGGGKTTLFRILSTLTAQHAGTLEVFGEPLPAATARVRSMIGVVFQKPSLDGKLTVGENLHHHGMLYGMSGQRLRESVTTSLARLGLTDRTADIAETLSGGLQRRVELAKALMTRPRLLILDEPSTGLDPGARHDLWRYLVQLREEDGTTVILTTHLMDEAERSDRIAILHAGRRIALGTPDELRSRIGGDVISIRTHAPDALAERVDRIAGTRAIRLGDTLRLESPSGHALMGRLLDELSEDIDGISLSKPTLEDVFVRETGHRFWNED
jgi:ABC-2 type transport system ATP-binding protein